MVVPISRDRDQHILVAMGFRDIRLEKQLQDKSFRDIRL
eukprot:CAMPEP_0114330886 /NCGR_PEP_ID=MMETSP0101-20121206/2045_1 /TAXON_ID=38822 ORGANISM="Pteridomonas danica, Strain PT" /NCGR_SAMPLE_ID=MMETSP0101 /ASSEMBLY_ACC=CAM_ASM_000211 /LENGTH=38 /DNA_ID= /DNA_START= /DNA_END= /DNA_ORIENTATION=